MKLLVRSGAYEPPKEAKEHETGIHDNLNYATEFGINMGK